MLVCSLFSCQRKINADHHQVEKYGTIAIPLDSTVNPSGTTFQYIDSDSGEFLALQNKAVHGIEIFDINSGSHVRSIKLNKDGPNRTGEVNGFRIFSLDSVLLASYPQKLALFNFNGEKTADFAVKDPQNEVNYISSTSEIPFLFSGKSVFGAQPFFRNFFDMTASDLSGYSHIYEVDLADENPSAEWLPISNPADSWDKGKKVSKFTWTDRGDSILVSPYNDHRIWVVSKKQKKLLDLKTSNLPT